MNYSGYLSESDERGVSDLVNIRSGEYEALESFIKETHENDMSVIDDMIRMLEGILTPVDGFYANLTSEAMHNLLSSVKEVVAELKLANAEFEEFLAKYREKLAEIDVLVS